MVVEMVEMEMGSGGSHHRCRVRVVYRVYGVLGSVIRVASGAGLG